MNTTRLTSSVVFLGLLGAFAAPAHATTTVQNFSTSGTQVTVDTGTTDSTGCVTIFVDLAAVTSMTRSDGTKSSGSFVSGEVQLFNSCTGVVEFGSIFADVGTGFSAGSKSATLNATIVVEMDQFDADFNFLGVVDRTLVASALTWTPISGETFVARSHTRETFPGSKSVSNGQGVDRVSNVTGGLTVDGQDVLVPGTLAFLETSSSNSVTLTKS
jgi:hypothetical protein